MPFLFPLSMPGLDESKKYSLSRSPTALAERAQGGGTGRGHEAPSPAHARAVSLYRIGPPCKYRYPGSLFHPFLG